MVLTEHNPSSGGEEEAGPPFLLETTEFVRAPAAGPNKVDAMLESIGDRRPPYELLALVGLVGALVIVYFAWPRGETEVADPLLASQAPSSIVVSERTTLPASGENPDNLSGGGDPTAVQTAPLPSSTALPTTTIRQTTTTLETTTTEAPTTTEQPQPTNEIIGLNNCEVETRNNTVVYATPSDQDPLGRVSRDEYPALAKSGNWYLIEVNGSQGWVDQGRIRDFDGNCRD